ncbi:MAG: family 1 glycosylhydrolase, partial [Deltaproteobacteria bacterium]|nr:family 1 glycosylhydrolase [Deltaproteobacteria bacterium]
AIDRYAEMMASLRRRNIEPVVTFLHFTHPRWFHELCPWHHVDGGAPDRFARFVDRMMRVFGRQARWYTVLNEPMVWLLGGYLTGVIPPGRAMLAELFLAAQTLVRGYLSARDVIRRYQPQARCGIAHNVLRFSPDRPRDPRDQLLARAVSRFYNMAFPEVLTTGKLSVGLFPGLRYTTTVEGAEGSMDFLGINYYTRVYVRFDPFRREGRAMEAVYDDRSALGVSDLGWEIHPLGLYEVLRQMAFFGVPILVTENGLDDRYDDRHSRFLYDHLSAMLAAIRDGVDVRGYLHWSLLDNFEWLDAFVPRFGLFRVDYATKERFETRAAASSARSRSTGGSPRSRLRSTYTTAFASPWSACRPRCRSGCPKGRSSERRGSSGEDLFRQQMPCKRRCGREL